MKIIITENQLKDNIIHLIKTEGSIETCQMLALSAQELAETFFNNNPMEFLNIFNDLKTAKYTAKSKWTVFKNEKGHVIMIYDREIGMVDIDFSYIWFFLRKGFNLTNNEVRDITEEWLSEIYNIKDVTTDYIG
jgi:hypothetical protein